MTGKDWFSRFLCAFAVSFVVLCMVHLFRGRQLVLSVSYGLVWGLLTASLFTVIGYTKYRRCRACVTRPPSGGSPAES
ncbi:hypothetical protein [Pirellula sp. SH-Sr6A]|uniref:hypothetical protein n=1 Tax=Pirellula sp. SH-Sr6A TaxID=1632865 RepID=UPI0011BA80FA|nr:hypothetical protein [Pirellula sp. SH-Sr6A]